MKKELSKTIIIQSSNIQGVAVFDDILTYEQRRAITEFYGGVGNCLILEI
jgi:hypothetical protein